MRRVNQELNERQVPLMGVTAAFIFAAQMMNFAVAGGTSGHLLGGALAAILLGPWAGMLVLTSVLAVQALLFQDGGLLALGANVFNMAVVGVLVGWVVYTGVETALRRQNLDHDGQRLCGGLAVGGRRLAGGRGRTGPLGRVALGVVLPAMGGCTR